MKWSKKLSLTDAQEETTGYPVPYIRLTKSGSPHDTKAWFRTTFFHGMGWQSGFFGEHPVETCQVDFDVTIMGQNFGSRSMLVTHDDTRQQNNNAPNTWVHYDDATRDELRSQALSGNYIVLQNNAGSYSMVIQAAAPNPPHV